MCSQVYIVTVENMSVLLVCFISVTLPTLPNSIISVSLHLVHIIAK